MIFSSHCLFSAVAERFHIALTEFVSLSGRAALLKKEKKGQTPLTTYKWAKCLFCLYWPPSVNLKNQVIKSFLKYFPKIDLREHIES